MILLGELAKRAEKLIADNAPAILTTLGVTGTITTAYLAVKASFKAAEVIGNEEMSRTVSVEPNMEPMTSKEKAELVWKLYIPAAAMAGMTVAAIIGVNHIGNKRAAALASAYSLVDKAYAEYREKNRQVIGKEKEQEVRDKISKDKIDKAKPLPVVFAGSGKFLCLDEYSGRTFRANKEDIREAVNTTNALIHSDNYASLSDFWEELGLEKTSGSDELGWNTDRLISVEFSGGVAPDGEPYIAYRFCYDPAPRYHLSSY